MKRFALLVSSMVVLLGLACSAAAPEPEIGEPTRSRIEIVAPPQTLTAHDVLAVINASRTENGRPLLVLDPGLSASARLKLADMQDRAYFDHVSPDGQYVWPVLKQAGCHYRHAGENLAFGYSDARQIERAWMQSSEHRDNMLNRRYGVAGVAVSQHPSLVVVLFADSC